VLSARLNIGCSLRVPRYGAMLEFLNFGLLLLTFVICLVGKDCVVARAELILITPRPERNMEHVNLSEAIFVLFAVSFVLEEYTAQKEHGWAGNRFPALSLCTS
jgi:hypothetical protein